MWFGTAITSSTLKWRVVHYWIRSAITTRKCVIQGYAWPVVDIQVRYMQGARFGQQITVQADLVEWESRLKINYLILDSETGERLTRGLSVQVAVAMAEREMQFVTPPDIFQDAVRKAIQ